MNPKWKIPLYKIYTDDEDLALITKIIKRGQDWALGPEILEFENAIKNYVGTNYCLALNSGTSALHACLIAFGIGKNDRVIVPSFSFISTANAVLFVGGLPVFADVEETTFGLDPKSIENKLDKNTKAILPMDYGGLSCQINEIKKIAENRKITLLEDAAESLGSSINGKKVGTISDAAIFSFCGNKVLTTGEGGAIVTNSRQIYEKIKLIRSHGRVEKSNYFSDPLPSDYVDLGYNWRMSSITAALGISQLQKLDKIIKMRQENANYISSRISKIPHIKLPTPPHGYEHIYQMFTIRISNSQLRNDLQKFLTEKGIFSKVYFNPIHKTELYKKIVGDVLLPVTEKTSKEVLTLPLYPNMTNEEKNYLIDSIIEFFE